jgi:hypothetical protein
MADKAQRLGAALEDSVSVLHTSEEGTPIRDFAAFAQRGNDTRIVQPYSRMYCLQIVRWLAYLMYDLSSEGGYTRQIEPLFGLYERFSNLYATRCRTAQAQELVKISVNRELAQIYSAVVRYSLTEPDMPAT